MRNSRLQRSRHYSAFISQKQSIELPNVPNLRIQISKTLTRADVADRRKEHSYMEILRQHEHQAKFFESAHYESMAEEAIKREHRHLRMTLQSINAQLAFMLEEVQSKPLPSPEKKVDLPQLLRQKEKQIENNRKLIHFFGIEYAVLLRRLKMVAACPRELTQRAIHQTQTNIESTKTDIRDIKKDRIALNHSLLDEEGLVRQMKDLERQKTMVKTKIEKNTGELQKCMESVQELEQKTTDLNTVLGELETKVKLIDEAEQRLQASQRRASTLLMKKMHLDTLKKKTQSTKIAFEQMYLQKLKELEKCIGNIRKHSHLTNEILNQVADTNNTIAALTKKVGNMHGKQPKKRPDSNQRIFTDNNFTESSIPAHPVQVLNTMEIDIEPEMRQIDHIGGSEGDHGTPPIEEEQSGRKQSWRIHGTATDLLPEQQGLVLPDRPKLSRKIQLKRFNRSISTHEQEIVLEESP